MIPSLLLSFGLAAPAEPPEVLRARAALALALSAPADVPYPEQYRRALAAGEPLVVFVGQPARPVAGCLVASCATFPGVAAPAVVVGVPGGAILARRDLPGTPADAAIRAALRGGP